MLTEKILFQNRGLAFYYPPRHTSSQHEGIVRFRCEFMNCTFGTSEKKRFKEHAIQHTFSTENRSGEKPNKCNQCDYASSRADTLKIHLKIHTVEKSNKCNQCDFASHYASSLEIHLKTHSTAQP